MAGCMCRSRRQQLSKWAVILTTKTGPPDLGLRVRTIANGSAKARSEQVQARKRSYISLYGWVAHSMYVSSPTTIVVPHQDRDQLDLLFHPDFSRSTSKSSITGMAKHIIRDSCWLSRRLCTRSSLSRVA